MTVVPPSKVRTEAQPLLGVLRRVGSVEEQAQVKLETVAKPGYGRRRMSLTGSLTRWGAGEFFSSTRPCPRGGRAEWGFSPGGGGATVVAGAGYRPGDRRGVQPGGEGAVDSAAAGAVFRLIGVVWTNVDVL